jgi:hypothetical protein
MTRGSEASVTTFGNENTAGVVQSFSANRIDGGEVISFVGVNPEMVQQIYCRFSRNRVELAKVIGAFVSAVEVHDLEQRIAALEAGLEF